MHKKYTILIIDDKVENLQYLKKTLDSNLYDVRATMDGYMGIEAAKLNKPDLILLDIRMPNIDGFEVCRILKEDETLCEVPIIFISALDEIEHKIQAFDEGGVDYITKPFEPKEVLARIKTQLEIHNSKTRIESLLEQQDIFVKKIMHEINTPLSVISLNANALERQYGTLTELESIKAASKTLSSIYGDISYIVKKEARKYEVKEIELVSFISSRIIFFDEMASIKELDIELISCADLKVLINEYELERVIDNTISNAIKYSNKAGLINVDIEKIEGRYILGIKDEGVGIENVDSIFEPYYQYSHKNVGLGLGLSIVKEIK